MRSERFGGQAWVRRAPRASVWVLSAGVAVVLLATLGVVTAMQSAVEAARSQQILLVGLQADVAELEVAQHVVTERPRNRAAWADVVEERHDIRARLRELRGMSSRRGTAGSITDAWVVLNAALGEQLRLLGQGTTARAARVHAVRVDPAFQRFGRVVQHASAEQARAAAGVARNARLGFWVVFIVASLAILAVARWYVRNREQVATELVESAERFRVLAESASEGVAVCRDVIVLEASAAFGDIFGRPPAELEQRSVAGLVDVEYRRRLADGLRSSQAQRFEATAVRRDGAPVTLEVRIRPTTYRGRSAHVLAVRDITEQKQLEERLKHQALHDGLTGLANRALFADRLEHALTPTRHPTGARVAVLFFDMDDLKVVNDSLGHEAGDQLLRTTAAVLRTTFRPSDTVARLGGDEFAVLIEDVTDVTQPTAAAERALSTLQHTTLNLPSGQTPISASVGVAIAVPGQHTASEALRRADMAMYAAKANGKGAHALFEPIMEREAHRRPDFLAQHRPD